MDQRGSSVRTETSQTYVPDFSRPLTVDDVVAIFTSDLPHQSDAQLAALLTEVFLSEPSPISDALAPIARAELARRATVQAANATAARMTRGTHTRACSASSRRRVRR